MPHHFQMNDLRSTLEERKKIQNTIALIRESVQCATRTTTRARTTSSMEQSELPRPQYTCKTCFRGFEQEFSLIQHCQNSQQCANKQMEDFAQAFDGKEDEAMVDYNARKRTYDDDSEDELGEIKRTRYDDGEAANNTEAIVTGFLYSIRCSGEAPQKTQEIVDHISFESYWISRKREHYISALIAVLTAVNDAKSVSLENVARNLSAAWTKNREFDWDHLIIMFAIAGSLYKKRPELYTNIHGMLTYYCALNNKSIEYIGGWEQSLNYTNLDLTPET